jgi:hypothetical protein
MEKVKVRDQNADFGKPVDWDPAKDGNCGNLPIRREQIGRRQYHFSNWLPNAAELAHLNAGGVVELCCVGVQPPVSVGVCDRAPDDAPSKDRDLEALKRATPGAESA